MAASSGARLSSLSWVPCPSPCRNAAGRGQPVVGAPPRPPLGKGPLPSLGTGCGWREGLSPRLRGRPQAGHVLHESQQENLQRQSCPESNHRSDPVLLARHRRVGITQAPEEQEAGVAGELSEAAALTEPERKRGGGGQLRASLVASLSPEIRDLPVVISMQLGPHPKKQRLHMTVWLAT